MIFDDMHLSNSINPTARGTSLYWWGFCLLLGFIFVLRGQAVLQLYPAMEGFDEVQHTAYLMHLAEHRTLPVLGETRVPVSLYPEIANNPHSDLSMGQAGLVGALKYRHFFTHHPTTNLQAEILLFQAQHPPVYYLLTWRLFDRIRTDFGYREAVYVLRSIQLLLGAAALVLMLSTLTLLIRDPGIARLAALAVSLVPMNLIYILRVSNDALAVLLASTVFVLLAHIRDDNMLIGKAVVIGLLLAAGAMTKTIAFLFLPVAVVFLFFLLFDRSFSRVRVMTSLVAVPLVYMACCHRYHLASKEKFGTMFPALETILNAEKHHNLIDLINAIKPSDLWTFFLDRLIKNNVWKSGMTFLEPHDMWEWLVVSVLLIGAAGWLVRLIRPEDRRALWRPEPGRYLLLCLLSVGATFAGAYMHGLNCRLAWGQLITPAYYVMVAFPALLALAIHGLLGWPRRLVIVSLTLLTITYMAAEFDSLLRIAVPYWTNSRDPGVMIDRLRILSSSWTDPWFALLWWSLAAIGLGTAITLTARSLRAQRLDDHARF
jgi:4-amino-4-deoxy-L-arabinose transferase-like glycosyltransferase